MFCINYYPHENYVKNADQFKIKYRPADRTLKDFLEKYQDKSIVIDITETFDDTDAKLFASLYETYKNFKLIVDYYNQECLNKVQELEIPFFFINPVNTFDKMQGFLTYHPTDMYICEELGFHLDKISEYLHKNNVRVRVYPNICQSSCPDIPSIKTFFVRPEDIEAYSKYVDVFELISDHDRQELILKVYQQGKWFGEVSEIIPSYKGNLNSRYLIRSFGEIRAKCKKRCVYGPEACNICERFVDIGKAFQKYGIIVKKKKSYN